MDERRSRENHDGESASGSEIFNSNFRTSEAPSDITVRRLVAVMATRGRSALHKYRNVSYFVSHMKQSGAMSFPPWDRKIFIVALYMNFIVGHCVTAAALRRRRLMCAP